MKKLMIALAAVCTAALANAGAVNWGSGALQTPGEGGVLSGTKLTSSSGYNVSMYVWESLTASAVSFEAGDLYTWYSKGASTSADPFGGTLSAINGSVNMSASATTATATGSELTTTGGTSVYGAVLFVLTDSDGKDQWYMENAGSIGAKAGSTKTSLANLGLKVGGGSGTTATSWTAVPEPTSGLLLLLGMAGLALKRKRA